MILPFARRENLPIGNPYAILANFFTPRVFGENLEKNTSICLIVSFFKDIISSPRVYVINI